MSDESEKALEAASNLPMYAGPGQPAAHKYAVLYQGPWETLEDGTCRAVRMNARALSEVKIQTLLKSFTHSVMVAGQLRSVMDVDLSEDVTEQVRGLNRTSAAFLSPRILHLVAVQPEDIRLILHPRSVQGRTDEETVALRQKIAKSTALYTVWERDRVDRDVARALSMAGQCWVPCHQNARMLVESGVPEEQVRVVPHPFDPDMPLALRGPQRHPDSSTRRFYSIGAWQPRKGMSELIGAFLRVFTPVSDATLTLKINRTTFPGYPTPEEAIRKWIADPLVTRNGWTIQKLAGKLRIIDRRLKEAEIQELHMANNIYVSASHGEAWGLPAFDSKIAGNRLVHVPWGGTADFAGLYDVAIPYVMGAVDPVYKWGDDVMWADYRMEDLQRTLRETTAPKSHWREDIFDETFSLKAVGTTMRQHLLDMCSESGTFAKHLEVTP